MKMKKLFALLFAAVMILSIMPMAVFADDAQYAARLLQVDSVSGSRIPISGAEYEILDKDGNVIELVKTDATGAARLTNKLSAGEYGVRSVKSPAGYAKPEDVMKVTITSDNLSKVLGVNTYSMTVEMDAIRGSIVACDKDGKPIEEAGVIFTLCNESGSPFESVVTNDKGVASFKKNIPYGNYLIKQTKAPRSYYLDRTPVKVSITDKELSEASDGTMTFEIDVKHYELNAILVVKDAETKQEIKKSGMEFHVQDAEGNELYDLITEKGGIAAFPESVAYDEYKIFPDALPEGYYLNQNETVFKITEGDIELLEDGTYQYTCVFMATPVYNAVVATVTGPVLAGTREGIRNGYDIVIPVFVDDVIEGVELSVVAAEEILLNEDVKADADEVLDSAKTNGKGVASLKKFYVGLYNVVIDEVPNGYVLDKEYTQEIELTDGNQKKDMRYEKIDVSIEMKKAKITLNSIAEYMASNGTVISFEEKPLEGVVYGLYTAEAFAVKDPEDKDASIPENTLIDVAVSDSEGVVTFEGQYPVGKYVVKQLDVPEHYIKNENYAFNLDLSDCEDESAPAVSVAAEVDPVNEIMKADVSIKSVDQEQNSLEGAEFAIFDASGKQIAYGTTVAGSHNESNSTSDELGAGIGSGESVNVSVNEVVFKTVLAPGKYSVKQMKAANGYSLNPESFDFEITDECVPAEIAASCEKTVIELVNLDKDGKPQAGVEFTAYDKDGNEIAKAVSDENGIVRFEGLEQGQYEIKQTGSANGYKASDPIKVDVNDNWQNGAEPKKIENKKDYTWIWFVAGGVALCAIAGAVIGIVVSKKKKEDK